MMRVIPRAIVLLGLVLLGLGFYALIAGQIPLIRGSVRGPFARVVGVVLIVFAVACFPILLRVLVGLSMNLGLEAAPDKRSMRSRSDAKLNKVVATTFRALIYSDQADSRSIARPVDAVADPQTASLVSTYLSLLTLKYAKVGDAVLGRKLPLMGDEFPCES